MPCVNVAGAPIDYSDTGGGGPVLVFLHGIMMDASLWATVIESLPPDYRCIAPTLPLGAHRRPVPPSVELSLPGVASLVVEFLDRVDVHDVTLIGNDTGGAVAQLVGQRQSPRISRIVLASCEAFDNIPSGLPGRTLAAASKLSPTLFRLALRPMRLRPLRRSPLAFGWMTKRGDATTLAWLTPLLTNAEVRRDTLRLLRRVVQDKDVLSNAAERLCDARLAVAVVWASEDKVMPFEHAERLCQTIPSAGLAAIDDSYTLIPLDQPQQFAHVLRQLVSHNPP